MTQIIQTPEMKAAQEKAIAALTGKYGENWRSNPDAMEQVRKETLEARGQRALQSGFTSPEGMRRLGQQAPGGGYSPEKSRWMTQVAPGGHRQAPVAPSGGDLPGGGTRQSLPENMSAGSWGGGQDRPQLQVYRQAPESPSIAAPNITKPKPRPERPGLHSGGGDKLFKITPAESA